MQITRMKINGVPEPIGYRYDYLTLSWNVEVTAGTRAEMITVDVSDTQDFSKILFHAEDADLDCAGVNLKVDLLPRTRYYVRVQVADETGDTGAGTTWFETGKAQEPWVAKWLSMREGDAFHPVFSKDFACEQEVSSARLYVCGLGLFEAYIGSEKVGDEFLTPYFTDYTESAQVITYDITGMLGRDNSIEIMLGNGWYKGRFGMDGTTFGDRFALIAEMHITYADGTEAVIGTDESWMYRPSDIQSSGLYDGEVIDRRVQGGNQNQCRNAVIIEAPVQTADRLSLPVRIIDTLNVADVITTPAGETVLDMGQNFSGWIEFDADLEEGTEIHLEFGEVLQNGCFYNDNYRSATGGFTYISGGRRETVRPHFTYFGFRYVRVTGWPGEVDKKAFRGCVIGSDLERTGWFECGDKKVNRLYENTFWGMRSNFVDIPTDCPQRDERMGWTGDAQIFAPTASYHADTRAFFHKFEHMMRTEQQKNDRGIPAYVPSGHAFCPVAALWGDSATFIPNTIWKFYRGTESLTDAYPMMKEWTDYVGRQIAQTSGNPWGLWVSGFQFGDWLALDGRNEQSFKGGTPDEYVASMYYCRSLEIMAQTAEILGLDEASDYRELWQKQYDFLLDEYFTPHGHLCVTTQAAYIIAMQFDICRDKQVLARDFAAKLKMDGYRIRAGFAGAPNLCQVLSKYGNADLAYTFLLNEGFPGWMYAVDLGATTIWERWNSILPDGTISGTVMNSLNHYSYGSVAEFLYSDVLGIKPSEDSFRRAVIAPKPDLRLGYAEGRFRSSWGDYSVSWKIAGDGMMHVEVTVPFGCSAMVFLPDDGNEPFEVTAGSWKYDYMPVRDYRKPFGPECLLGRVFRNEEARNLLLSMLPQAAAFDNEDGYSMQIADLFELAAQGANPASVGAAIGALSNIVIM